MPTPCGDQFGWCSLAAVGLHKSKTLFEPKLNNQINKKPKKVKINKTREGFSERTPQEVEVDSHFSSRFSSFAPPRI